MLTMQPELVRVVQSRTIEMQCGRRGTTTANRRSLKAELQHAQIENLRHALCFGTFGGLFDPHEPFSQCIDAAGHFLRGLLHAT
jgi:hypothetical protein